jgi:pimeloyl-ACP methyl ester carboxylesterase
MILRSEFLGKAIIRKAVRVSMVALCVILVCALTILVYFFAKSPGKLTPFRDENGSELGGSISEKIHISINGAEQGMFIRGKDTANPVLLFLHGGPGMPEYFMFDKYNTGLENHFTVCYWELRGAGLSFRSGMSGDDITAGQLVSDAAAVANYLRERFGQDKVYLMAHSWGTITGIRSAAANPELFHAYIGISQIKNQAESEVLAVDYMLERYAEAGNAKRVKELQRFGIHNGDAAIYDFSTSSLRDTAMHELGVGSMRDMNSVVSGIFFPLMNCSAYTLKEKINIWLAKSFLRTSTDLIRDMLNTDLSKILTEFDIPIYFIAGLYDYTVNYGMQKDYFLKIDAPLKGFYTFENSAHSPPFEEPGRFNKIIIDDVLNGKASLTD